MYNGSGSPYTAGASFKNGGAKKSLAKAQNGTIVKKSDIPRDPREKPDSFPKDPGTTPPPGYVSKTPSMSSASQRNPYSSSPATNTSTPKPGLGKKIARGVKKVVANVKEAASERKDLKEYKKKVKNNNGLSPYTTGASFKTGGMVNSNAKIAADKTPGSKGTKVGLNKRVAKPKGKKC